MEQVTVAELRQNPTAAIHAVENGNSLVVTKHRRPVARLVPVESEPVTVIPPKNPGPSNLSGRKRRRSDADIAELLRAMASDT